MQRHRSVRIKIRRLPLRGGRYSTEPQEAVNQTDSMVSNRGGANCKILGIFPSRLFPKYCIRDSLYISRG